VKLPWWLFLLMLFNVAVDFGAGFIPILGDILDMFYRANVRNADALTDFLAKDAAKKAGVGNGGGRNQRPQQAQQQYGTEEDGRDLEKGEGVAGPAAYYGAEPARMQPAAMKSGRRPDNAYAPPARNLTHGASNDPRDNRR
jgi:hypothetical protein